MPDRATSGPVQALPHYGLIYRGEVLAEISPSLVLCG